MPRLSTNSALWITRVLWLAALALVPLAIDSATRGRPAIASNVSLTAWWVAAGAVLVALVVCGPAGLTVSRMVVPTSVPVAAATLLFGATAVRGVAALACATLVTLAVFTAETGEATVQTAAYGDERRLPLRLPAAMQLPIAVSWTLWLGASLAGVLLLAGGSLVGGVAVLVVAIALTWLLYQRLHHFSCRWLVSVPAGVVVHDSVVLGETLMVMRANVQHAQLALATTEAADLTGPAAGHALEITVHEMVQVTFAGTSKNPKGSAIHAQAFLVAPSRPGRALQALTDRKISVR
ncbi:MAG: hypothetical protein K8R99_11320 [Actinomycetia bacterium]|nr:hypothetical protein [Actinomycetes bacterium]